MALKWLIPPFVFEDSFFWKTFSRKVVPCLIVTLKMS